MQALALRTTRSHEAIDITDALARLGAPAGLALVSTPHTTAGLIICEADEEMLRDIERLARDLLRTHEPFEHRKNDNPNAAAHLLSAMLGTQLILEVTGDGLRLGTYQRVIFVEMDGPRDRRVELTPLGGAAA